MSYEDAIASAWTEGGPATALELLRTIFHASDNQKIQGKPTDYLSDRDDEYVSPAYGFDRMMKQFTLRWMEREELLEFLEEVLLESRSPGADQKHRIQPFNALVVAVSTYGHGDANIRSVSVSDGHWKAQYGLYHQLVSEEDNYDPETEDDEDTYDFIYALEDGERYQLKHEDEVIDGSLIFSHVRQAQYAIFAQEIVRELFLREAIAEFPKALPLRLFVTSDLGYGDEGSTDGWFEVGEVLSEALLADHPLRDQHLKSAEPPPELTTKEKWLYLLEYAGQPDTPEFAELVELLNSNDDLRANTLQVAILKRDGSEPNEELQPAHNAIPWKVDSVDLAHLWWSLGSENRDDAIEYVRADLSSEFPTLEGLELDDALEAGRSALGRLFYHWRGVPEDAKPALQADVEAAFAKARKHPHIAVRVRMKEIDLREKHGDEVIKLDRWGAANYQIEHIDDDYIEALSEVIAVLPESFPGFGGCWDFVMNRVEGLGERAKSLAPSLVDLLDRWCKPNRGSGQQIKKFAEVLFKIGLESPPAMIHEYCERDQYHMMDFYAGWAERLPRLKWEEFRAGFDADSSTFASAHAWMNVLIDNQKAIDLFTKNIQEAEDIDAIIARLSEAAKGDDAVQSFAVSLAIKLDDKGRHKLEDIESTKRVVQILEACDRDDEAEQLLRRARLLLTRFEIDAGGCPDIGALLETYPDHPMLLYLRNELIARDQGASPAADACVAAIKTLSNDDIVYRKAFFQFTDVSPQAWDTAQTPHGYTAYRWAYDYFQSDCYREGEFRDGQRSMDHDPYYRGLERLAAKLTEEQLAEARREAVLELEFDAQMQSLSDADLAERMTPDSWNITSAICRKLGDQYEVFGQRLLQAYRWFRKDESRRKALLMLYWPHEGFRDQVLAFEPVHEDLAWIIRRLTGATARDVLDRLAEAGRHDLVLKTAKELPSSTVQTVFKSVYVAIHALDAHDEGIALLEKMRDEISDKKPEYVLLTTNKGVLEYRKGDASAAAQTFDALFEKDWSRFDYDPSTRDPLMASILGGDLDAQIAGVFRQYFAMAKFNAACVFANTGRTDDAVAVLREASQLHETYTIEKFEADDDLAPARDTEAYRQLVAELGGE